jgi:PelA/Pel-15E family pectate lyase
LQPTSARNYEMPSLCSGESAGIVAFLMQQPSPDSNTVAAVRAAVAWFEKTQIRDVEFRKVDKQGRLLVPARGKGPLWARYYEIGSDRPIFGERDKTIHDRVDEISMERRNGYAWFTGNPGGVLKKYQKWNAAR